MVLMLVSTGREFVHIYTQHSGALWGCHPEEIRTATVNRSKCPPCNLRGRFGPKLFSCKATRKAKPMYLVLGKGTGHAIMLAMHTEHCRWQL
eukprot:2020399-Amphidinium_carterae.1